MGQFNTMPAAQIAEEAIKSVNGKVAKQNVQISKARLIKKLNWPYT